jgi:hypothetical protein
MKRNTLFWIDIEIFIFVLVVYGFFSVFNVDRHHDFLLFKPAVDILHGKILFKDVFTQYGALTTYIQAAGVWLFGEYVVVLRLTTALFYALTAVVLLHIWSRFLKNRWLIGAMFLWIALAPFYHVMFHPWSSVYSLFFQCASLLSVIKSIETKKIRYDTLAGLFAALAFWCRQPVGIFHEASILAFYFAVFIFDVSKRTQIVRSILANIRGVIAGIFLILIPITISGALMDFWLQSFVLAKAFAVIARGITVMQLFKSIFIASLWKQIYVSWIWLVLPFSVVFALYKTVWKKHSFVKHLDGKQLILLVVSFSCLASWLQYYPRVEIMHLYWASSPMIGVLLFVIAEWITGKRNENRIEIISFIILGAVMVFEICLGIIRIAPATYSIQTPSFFKGLHLSKDEYIFYTGSYTFLRDYLSEHPDKTYVNYSADALYAEYVPEKYYQIDNIYVDWDFLNDSIALLYRAKRDAYIKQAQPVVIVNKKRTDLEGYAQFTYLLGGLEVLNIAVPDK